MQEYDFKKYNLSRESMKKLIIVGVLASLLSGCAHYELSRYDGKTFEVCGNTFMKAENWEKATAQYCSGTSEVIGGSRTAVLTGANYARTLGGASATLTHKERICRKYSCSGAIAPQ